MVRATSLLTLLSLLVTAPAHAQDRLALTWTAPEGCPDDAMVRAEVVRLLGGAIPAGEPVAAEGTTEATAGAFRLTLRTRMNDADGERVLEAAACGELADAAALIVALMIDPEAVAEAPSAEPGPEPEPELPDTRERRLEVRTELATPDGPAEPEPEPAPEPEPEPAPEPEPETLAGFLALGGGLDVGSVPGVSGWLWLEGGFGIPILDGRLRVGAVLPQPAGTETRGADIYAFSVDARACLHPFEGVRGLAACGGLMLAVAVAEGFGFSASETGSGTYAGAMLGLEAEWRPVDGFGIGLDATLVVPFPPYLEFAARGDEETPLHTSEPVAGRFGLRVAAHFR